jgi:hypothetical protein
MSLLLCWKLDVMDVESCGICLESVLKALLSKSRPPATSPVATLLTWKRSLADARHANLCWAARRVHKPAEGGGRQSVDKHGQVYLYYIPPLYFNVCHSFICFPYSIIVAVISISVSLRYLVFNKHFQAREDFITRILGFAISNAIHSVAVTSRFYVLCCAV